MPSAPIPYIPTSVAQSLHQVLVRPTSALISVIVKPLPISQYQSPSNFFCHRFHPSSNSIALPTLFTSVKFSTSKSLSRVASQDVEETVESFIDGSDSSSIEDESRQPITAEVNPNLLSLTLKEKKELAEVNPNLPSLTVKEKKELASYANGLGKKLKCQLVGKSGITTNVAASFIETLEANELLKIKFHSTCPGDLEDAVRQLQEATGSIVVGQIGRTVIIYRPSLTKLKAEQEKKRRLTTTWKPRVFARAEKDDRPPNRFGMRKASSPRRFGKTKSDT